MKVYKACREIDGKIFSCVIGYGAMHPLWEDNWKVEYIPNTPTYPRIEGSLLLAFRTLKNAREFCKHEGVPVWRAEAEGVVDIPQVACFYGNAGDVGNVGNINHLTFWRGDKSALTFKAPLGTVGCKSITLIRKLKKLSPPPPNYSGIYCLKT